MYLQYTEKSMTCLREPQLGFVEKFFLEGIVCLITKFNVVVNPI